MNTKRESFSGENLGDYLTKDRRDIIAFLILCALGIVAYLKSFSGDFQFDGYDRIVNNPFIKNFNFPIFWSHYKVRFITNLTFVFNYLISGLNVFSWHFVNLLIHICASFFAYRIVLLTFQTPKLKNQIDDLDQYTIALFSSLVFLLHPIQTQAVTYIIQRATCLASLFYLGTIYFYVMARLGHGRINYAKAIAFSILGMFSKPIVITLPIMVILYNALFFGIDRKIRWGRFVLSMFLSLPVILIPFYLFGREKLTFEVIRGYQVIPQPSYLLTQLNVFMTYIRLCFLPINQNLDYDYKIVHSLLEFPTFLSLMAILAIIILAIRLIRNHRMITFGIFWFFITLSPQLSLFPLRDVIFEHRVYLACFGFSVFIGFGLFKILKRKRYFVVMSIILSALTLLTFMRNSVWSDPLKLLEDVVAKSPNKARPHNNLGFYHFQRGELSKAEVEFKQAIKLDKNYPIAYNNLGMVYLEQEKMVEAEEIFKQLINDYPRYPEPYVGLGNIYTRSGVDTTAMNFFRNALQLDPNNVAAYVGLGDIYQEWGQLGQAKINFERATKLKPESASAFYNLGNVYFKLGEYYEAVLSYQKAIKLKSDFAEAHNNLGSLYTYYFWDYSRAITHYERAISINPEFAEAHFNLANTLYAMGHLMESMRYAYKALDLYREQGQEDKVREIEEKLSLIKNQ